MISIKELHIGNHVLYNGEQRTVSSIDLSDGFAPFVAFEGRGKFHHCKDIEPIPITEELLKELGFDIRPFKYRLKAERYLSEFDEFLMLERMKGEDKFDIYLYISKAETHKTHLKYLHELENFVYLTTKKELI